MKKREKFCTVNRSEVAVALVEGEAEMQSRNVDSSLGKRFATLVAVATLFFSVAIPTVGFAKPDGDPKADEVRLFHNVWVVQGDKKEWKDTYMKKFSEDDLKTEPASDKVKNWMEQLKDGDDAKNAEFLKLFVKDPKKKTEVSEPFKLVQALSSVLIARTEKNIKDNGIAAGEADKRKEAMKAEAKKLWDWLAESKNKDALKNALGSKWKAFIKLFAKVLGRDGQQFKDADNKEIKGKRPETIEELAELLKKDKEEDLIKALFEDEDKLGEEFAKKPEFEEPPTPPGTTPPGTTPPGTTPPGTTPPGTTPPGTTPPVVDPNAALNEFLRQQALAEALRQQQQGAIGEADLSRAEQAVNDLCNAKDDNNDDFEDLFNLARALQDAQNDDNRRRNDINDLLADLDRNNDRQQAANQGQGITPPAAQTAAAQPQQQGDDGGQLPTAPPRQEGPPPPPQALQAAVDTDPLKGINPTFTAKSVDRRDAQIRGTESLLRRLGSGIAGGVGDLFSSVSRRFQQFLPPAQQLQLLARQMAEANTRYTSFKRRADLHDRIASQMKQELSGLEKGYTDAMFARDNPTEGQRLIEMRERVKELKDSRKELRARGNQPGPGGVQQDPTQALAQVKTAIRNQEKEIRKLELKKSQFLAAKSEEYANDKKAYDRHVELANQARDEMTKAKGEFDQADGTQQQIAASLNPANNQVATIPNVNGGRQVSTGATGGFNRFQNPGFTGAPRTGATGATQTQSTTSGQPAGDGQFRGRLSGQR